jgi:purine catabolism regulator
MEQVLADGSVASAAAMIGEVFPNPIAVIDLTANLIVAGRSPRPETLDDEAWQLAARTTLSRALVRAARAAVDMPREEAWDLLLDHGAGRFKVAALIEPLIIDREAVGALMVFPRSTDFGDLDHLLLDSAKFALSVQMMRSFIRFRAESQTLTDLFSEIVEERWRDAADISARALRLGFDLAVPARLIAIGLPTGSRTGTTAGIELHRSMTRIAQEQHAQSSAVAFDDLIVCRLPTDRQSTDGGDGEEAARKLMRRIVEEAKRILDEIPIVVVSKLCGGLADYPGAWEQCRRMILLARRFKRRGLLTAQDFGPFPVLLSAADTDEVKSFVDGAIGAVARHDRKHGTAYIETLAQFLDQGCRTQACADAMGLHVTTLRYRLTRMHDLFGIEIDTPERRFSLELAIRLNKMVQERGPAD